MPVKKRGSEMKEKSCKSCRFDTDDYICTLCDDGHKWKAKEPEKIQMTGVREFRKMIVNCIDLIDINDSKHKTLSSFLDKMEISARQKGYIKQTELEKARESFYKDTDEENFHTFAKMATIYIAELEKEIKRLK